MEDKKKNKTLRADLLLIAGLLVLALALFAVRGLTRRSGNEAAVYVDGRLTGLYPLDRDAEIPIGDGEGYNLLVIRDGAADCSRAGECPTLPMWQELDDLTRHYLESVTLRDLMSGERWKNK